GVRFFDVLGVVPNRNAGTERGETISRRTTGKIGSAHAITERNEHFRDTAHAGAADADEMNMFDDVFHDFPSWRASATAAQTCATRSVASGLASKRARSAISASVSQVCAAVALARQ